MKLSWKSQMKTKQIHFLSSPKDLSTIIHPKTILSYLGGIKEEVEPNEMEEGVVEEMAVEHLEEVVEVEEMANKTKDPEIIPGKQVKEDQQAGKPLEQEEEVVDMEKGQKAGIPTLTEEGPAQAGI
jgi:hypothetical protein